LRPQPVKTHEGYEKCGLRLFLDENELTDFVSSYLTRPVPYGTFKHWTFEELLAIKFRTTILNRSVSHAPSTEPDLLSYEGEQANPTREYKPEESDRKWLESLIFAQISCPDLVPYFCADWTIQELYGCAKSFYPKGLPKPMSKETRN